MALLELSSISKTFDGGVEAVRSVDLRVDDGEFVSLLGPSGCGKSTLLRIAAGLVAPGAGEIVFPRAGPASASCSRSRR